MNEIAPAFLLPGAAVAAAVIVACVRLSLRIGLRKHPTPLRVMKRIYRPIQLMVALTAARVVLVGVQDFEWKGEAGHALLLGMIAAMAWMGVRLLYLVKRAAERTYEDQIGLHDRRRRTQITVLYRSAAAAVWTIAIGVALMTFPGVRAFGATLLASAGLASVFIGLAAQTMLNNVFAGVSLVFGDALRLEDVVEVDGEWGHVEEITLSYVVVRIWDERRLILPTSYFRDNPYRNWTHSSPAVMGVVELDVDWRLPMDAARAEMQRIVAATELWDGRVATLSVTETAGNLKRLRPLVSAANADQLWQLRCEVREKLTDWIAKDHPDCMPQLRVEQEGDDRHSRITAIMPMQPGSAPLRGNAHGPDPRPTS
ncbi:MAG: mechanosensitive ion channel family protein [Stackebrandtia sp.]